MCDTYASFIASHPDEFIHPLPFFSHIFLRPDIISSPADCLQSVRSSSSAAKVQSWTSSCDPQQEKKPKTKQKTLLGPFLPFPASAQVQLPKPEEDSRLNSNVGRTPNGPGAFYLLRGHDNENEIPRKSFNCCCCLSCKREGRESEACGVGGGGWGVILVSVTGESEKYGRGR